jgi:hypothetical protein
VAEGDTATSVITVVVEVAVAGPAASWAPPPTLTPDPKLAAAGPSGKFVYCVVIVTVAAEPASSTAGETETILGDGLIVSGAEFELANFTPVAVAPLILTA